MAKKQNFLFLKKFTQIKHWDVVFLSHAYIQHKKRMSECFLAI
jgi:hypothetical protein